MEIWDLTRKDHTELSILIGKVHITWMDESWNTCGIWST